MEKRYYDLIIKLIKEHRKYSGLEAILEDIANDVYEHSKIVISSVTNEEVIAAYLSKVVAVSIVTVPKKMNFNVKTRHHVITTIAPQTTKEIQTAPSIEQAPSIIEKSCPIEEKSVLDELVETESPTEVNDFDNEDNKKTQCITEDLELIYPQTNPAKTSLADLTETILDSNNIVVEKAELPIEELFESESEENIEKQSSDEIENNAEEIGAPISSVDKNLVDMMINGVPNIEQEDKASLVTSENKEAEEIYETLDSIETLEETTEELLEDILEENSCENNEETLVSTLKFDDEKTLVEETVYTNSDIIDLETTAADTEQLQDDIDIIEKAELVNSSDLLSLTEEDTSLLVEEKEELGEVDNADIISEPTLEIDDINEATCTEENIDNPNNIVEIEDSTELIEPIQEETIILDEIEQSDQELLDLTEESVEEVLCQNEEVDSTQLSENIEIMEDLDEETSESLEIENNEISFNIEETDNLIEIESGDIIEECEDLEIDSDSNEDMLLEDNETSFDLELDNDNEEILELEDSENIEANIEIEADDEYEEDTASSDVNEINESNTGSLEGPKFECFSYEPEKPDYDSNEILSYLVDIDEKHPERKILTICNLKYAQNLSVTEVANKVGFTEEEVLDVLNEIIDTIKD